jgi:hypothetical protein
MIAAALLVTQLVLALPASAPLNIKVKRPYRCGTIQPVADDVKFFGVEPGWRDLNLLPHCRRQAQLRKAVRVVLDGE